MRVIQLDGSTWKKPLDFYQALLDGIEQGYPHGMNVNAFIDSMIWPGMGVLSRPTRFLSRISRMCLRGFVKKFLT